MILIIDDDWVADLSNLIDYYYYDLYFNTNNNYIIKSYL